MGLRKIVFIACAVVVVAAAVFLVVRRQATPGKVSQFGEYQGYSEETYDGSKRVSDYLTLSDGTRLAYDVILPTQKGIPADQPLPVLFKYTPYGRTWTVFDKNGKLILGDIAPLDWSIEAYLRLRHLFDRENGRFLDPLLRDRWLGVMVKHGYVIVSVDRPGSGASFSSPTPGEHGDGCEVRERDPGLDRLPALVRWEHRHVRRLPTGRGPVCGGRGGQPALEGDLAGGQLDGALSGRELSGRRVQQSVLDPVRRIGPQT